MGQIAMPLVPDGPMRVFYERLHALHAAAGRPSMRQIQRGTRGPARPNGINPTTIHDAFTAPRPARWETVLGIVGVLGGDPAEVEPLWRDAFDADNHRRLDADNHRRLDADEPVAADRGAPRQLPPDVYAFTGRGATVAELDALASPAGGIVALSGTAGVGKTALAVHWAQHAAGAFPDGQLFADLRGWCPGPPADPGAVLAGFLRSLGVPSPDIPAEVAERSAAFRSLTADRRMLIVLDNARAAAQIRPLLPGAAGCLVLVTSRDALPGLVALNGARRVDLGLLDPAEAHGLLVALIGARITAEPVAAGTLADLCSRLPLALRIAAEFVTARPDRTLHDLVADLRAERSRLSIVDDDGPDTGIRSVFTWSYRALTPPAARLFRLLGLSVGARVDEWTAAALAGATPAEVRAPLDELARSHLLERAAGGRHTMHDLLRYFAARLADRDDPEADRQEAASRLLDHYLGTAARAMDLAFPAEQHRRPHPPAGAPGPHLADQVAALAWLDDARGDLVPAAEAAARDGRLRHALDLSVVLWRYLHNGALHTEAAALHTAALRAATGLGDRAGAAAAHVNLGNVHWRLGRYESAAQEYEQALDGFRGVGDQQGEARALANLGAVQWRWGRYAQARHSCQEAIARFTAAGDAAGQARALDNLGAVLARLGRYADAEERHRHALAITIAIGDTAGQARTLDNLGVVLIRQGRLAEAAECLRSAMRIFDASGHRTGQAEALEGLGALHLLQGDPAAALESYLGAVRIAEEIGSRARESSARNGAGEAALRVLRPDDAEKEHLRALELTAGTGDRYEAARAHRGLARVAETTHDEPAARAHDRAADRIFAELGVPEANPAWQPQP